MSKMSRFKFKKDLWSQKKKAHLIFNFMFLGFETTKSTVLELCIQQYKMEISSLVKSAKPNTFLRIYGQPKLVVLKM